MRNHIREHPEESKVAVLAVPVRRWGDIYKDGGRIAVFIASDDASFLTGMTFMVDGGMFMYP